METKVLKGSRVGKLPVFVPSDVTVKIDGAHVLVQGPKGKLEQTFNNQVVITLNENSIYFEPANGSRLAKAMQGTARAIVQNMIKGVKKPFTKQLEISGTGFKANLKGKVLELFLGKSHSDIYNIPEGITITVTDNTKLTIEGIDYQKVGQAAATIYHFRKPDPYKAKGVILADKVIYRKEGKSSA